MKDRITETIFSSIVKMVTNKSYYGCAIEDLKEAKEFREAIEETFLLTGKVKFGDYIPDLKWVDLQGITPLLRALGRKRDRILQQIVDKHK
ncbi:hypothetical protein AMTR_s00066p00166790 [Amborella trichopoda]|uniref:Uncharacterized protein n=1 Tax=Amborella trichopoda TaxID=13333 RepID=U5DFN3_AMBTC|nr:hypothetical protein AMTR_s00066p00166790 [Amborella trichopoda]